MQDIQIFIGILTTIVLNILAIVRAYTKLEQKTQTCEEKIQELNKKLNEYIKKNDELLQKINTNLEEIKKEQVILKNDIKNTDNLIDDIKINYKGK